MTIQYRRDLYKLLPPDFVSAEVGVASGLFTRDILVMGASKHYAVDSWETLNQMGDGGSPQSWHNENLESTMALIVPFGKRAIVLKGLSDHMAHEIENESLDLAYLDGDHSLEGVRRDIASYWPKIKSGGVLAGHDFLAAEYGVKAAVLEFCFDNNLTFTVIPEDKNEDAGFYIIKP